MCIREEGSLSKLEESTLEELAPAARPPSSGQEGGRSEELSGRQGAQIIAQEREGAMGEGVVGWGGEWSGKEEASE